MQTKKVGGEQRRGAKFGKLHIRHRGGSARTVMNKVGCRNEKVQVFSCDPSDVQ